MPVTEIAPLENLQRRPRGSRFTASQAVRQAERADAGRVAPLISGPAMQGPQSRVKQRDGDDDQQLYLPIGTLRQQYLDYLFTKVNEIEEQRESRHYYHGAHYTAEHIKILRARHQPILTWNRIGRKINGIVGLIERLRSDPKGLPTKPSNEDGAEVATRSIRCVLDGNDWKSRDPFCLLQCAIDSIAGVELRLTEGDKGDPDIGIAEVLGDEYFYDPTSIRYDFSDKRYDGIAKWIDVDEAVELFPEKEDEIRGLVESGSDLTTSADREYRWITTNRKRLRLVEHWYKHRGQWCWAFYVSHTLLEEGVSPFKDERGKTISRFIMFSCAVDHDGDRYSFVRNLKGPQDALNQSKSKSLHLANTKLVKATRNAVDDVEIARREVTRPDGWLTINQGGEFEIVDTKADLASFMKFAEDAGNEIEQYGNINVAAITGQALTNISGRAIELLRQPGMAELGPFIMSYRSWKLRVFRAIWNAIQQHWKAERWVRVTDNEGLAQFLKINGLELDEWGRPMIVNHVGSLDVDVVLEEGPDLANLMQDTYELIKNQQPGTFPPQVIIEASQLPRSEKDKLLKMMAPQQQPPDPAAEAAKRLSIEQLAAQNDDLRADAIRKQAEARKTHAAVEQVLADAALKRSGIAKNEASAARDAFNANLDAGDFALRAAKEAREALTPPEPAEGQPAPSPPTPVVLPHPMPQPPTPMPSAYPPPF